MTTNYETPFFREAEQFTCKECGAKPGEPCTALRNGICTTRGVSIVPPHISRTLAAKGLAHTAAVDTRQESK